MHYSSLIAVSEKIKGGQLCPLELTSNLLDRIRALDSEYGSFVCVLDERALECASRAKRELKEGRYRGPLQGIPLAVKDHCDTRFAPTAAGMPFREFHIPARSATVVERLEDAGAIILGKLTMSEGAFLEHRAELPVPSNPWSPAHWPGTSSSGSAIALSLGFCFGAIGSDTGGSIRYPSSCEGITGLKPTWGRVSRAGVFPLADSLDHIGPMARSAADCAVLLSAIAGSDPRDSTARHAVVPDYSEEIGGSLEKVRIGIDADYALTGATPEVRIAFENACQVLSDTGATLVNAEMPSVDQTIEAWLKLCAAEGALSHNDLFAEREGEYGGALAEFLRSAANLSGSEIAAAWSARLHFHGQLAGLFTDVDLLLTPIFLRGVPRLSDLSQIMTDLPTILRFTAPFNMSGNPTITFPGGVDAAGLPIGLQLVGRHLSEALVLRAGDAFQQRTAWHLRRPDGGEAND